MRMPSSTEAFSIGIGTLHYSCTYRMGKDCSCGEFQVGLEDACFHGVATDKAKGS